MNYDVRGPEGNVFCVLGALRGLQRQLKNAGCETPEIDKIFKDYRTMKYDEILDAIEKATHGSFHFVGRTKKPEAKSDTA